MTSTTNRIACLQMAVTLANQKLIPPGKIANAALSFIFVAEMDQATVERDGLLKLVRDHLDSMYDHNQRADLVEHQHCWLRSRPPDCKILHM